MLLASNHNECYEWISIRKPKIDPNELTVIDLIGDVVILPDGERLHVVRDGPAAVEEEEDAPDSLDETEDEVQVLPGEPRRHVGDEHFRKVAVSGFNFDLEMLERCVLKDQHKYSDWGVRAVSRTCSLGVGDLKFEIKKKINYF